MQLGRDRFIASCILEPMLGYRLGGGGEERRECTAGGTVQHSSFSKYCRPGNFLLATLEGKQDPRAKVVEVSKFGKSFFITDCLLNV